MWTRRWFIILTAAAVVTLALACQLVGQMSRDELQRLLKSRLLFGKASSPMSRKCIWDRGF